MSDRNHPSGSRKQKNGKTIKIGKKKIKIKRTKPVRPTTTDQDQSVAFAASGQKPKKTISKKKRMWKKIGLVALAVCVVGFLVGMGVIITWMIDAPELDLSDFEYTSTTVVYDVNGDYYQALQSTESRTPVSIDEVPKIVQLAFISIEDQRFYAHQGVDICGTIKAIFAVLIHHSTDVAGGSTITQQLIKNTVLTSEVSIERKVKEWKLAVELENEMSKDEIMEAYLNQINMSITWGIENAAERYFGEDVSELSVAQSAVLAAIVKAPYYYNPYDYETDEDGNTYLVRTTDEDGNTVIGYDEDNQERALLIVKKMYELGHISEGEYEIAKNELENNLIGLQVSSSSSSTYTYFTDAVYEQVLEDIQTTYNYSYEAAENLLLNGGLKIYSTVDPVIQNALEEQAADDSNFPSQSSSAKAASEAMTEYTGEEVSYTPEVGGAVIQNSTGYVVGIIGGREKTGSLTMNRALQKFQIGSTTKPLTVYSPGIDTGILTLATTFDNEPLQWGSWKVYNSPNTYTGMTTVREGLKESINIVAVLAQKTVGNDLSVEYGEKFGLEIDTEGSTNDLNSAALALGGYTYGQTPLAIASAFTTFPNGGYRKTPIFYTTVTDSDGNIILDAVANQETIDVISESTAFLMTDALEDVVSGGTTNRSIPGQEIGGKTGTTDNKACTWFTGFTSEYTGSFWWGYDVNYVSVNGKSYNLYIGGTSGGTKSPAAFWEKVFRQFYEEKDLPDATLQDAPDSVFLAEVDSVSGKAPTELSYQDPRGSTVITEYFAAGTYPTEEDDMHVLVTICKDSGMLAGDYCTNTETVVRIQKNTPDIWLGGTLRISGYVPSSEASVIAPTEVCTLHTSENSITGYEFSTTYDTNTVISSLTLAAGDSTMLYLKTVAASGVSNLTTESPTYTSSDESVLTVSASGNGILVQGVSEGTANITATYTYSSTYTISRTITVTVTAAEDPGGTEDPGSGDDTGDGT